MFANSAVQSSTQTLFTMQFFSQTTQQCLIQIGKHGIKVCQEKQVSYV